MWHPSSTGAPPLTRRLHFGSFWVLLGSFRSSADRRWRNAQQIFHFFKRPAWNICFPLFLERERENVRRSSADASDIFEAEVRVKTNTDEREDTRENRREERRSLSWFQPHCSSSGLLLFFSQSKYLHRLQIGAFISLSLWPTTTTQLLPKYSQFQTQFTAAALSVYTFSTSSDVSLSAHTSAEPSVKLFCFDFLLLLFVSQLSFRQKTSTSFVSIVSLFQLQNFTSEQHTGFPQKMKPFTLLGVSCVRKCSLLLNCC